MSCFLLIGAAVVLPLYAILETRMIVRLVRLLRHPARTAQFGLAASFISGLCYWPVLMMLLLMFLLGMEVRPPDDANLLELMTLAPFGAAFALCSWVTMTLWFRSIVNRDLAVYRDPISLVPVVILALTCLTYLAVFAWVFTRQVMRVGLLRTNDPFSDMLGLAVGLLLLYVPAAPLAGFVLLIVHVVRVRAAKTWETYVPPEEEEMP